MPLDITRTVCGGAKDLSGSYLANPIYTAILICIIIFIILIWHYWKKCSVMSHLTPMIYIFVSVSIVLICHNEVINNHYTNKYRNKAADELTDSLINSKEQALFNAMNDRAAIAPQVAPQVQKVTPLIVPLQNAPLQNLPNQ